MEKLTIQERKDEFCRICYNMLVNESITDFLEYWTEHSINGKKMRFEKEKVFDIKRRWGTWVKNNKKWNKIVNGNENYPLLNAINQLYADSNQ